MKTLNFFKNSRCSKFDIDINGLEKIKKENIKAILLDVRSPLEYKEEHLKSAINIPLYDLDKYCKFKIKDKNSIIIAYCQSGIRSKKAIKILQKNGFKNLYNLVGGLDGI